MVINFIDLKKALHFTSGIIILKRQPFTVLSQVRQGCLFGYGNKYQSSSRINSHWSRLHRWYTTLARTVNKHAVRYTSKLEQNYITSSTLANNMYFPVQRSITSTNDLKQMRMILNCDKQAFKVQHNISWGSTLPLKRICR